MKTTIKLTKEKADKMKFLFLPLYCDKCLMMIWLEKIPFNWTGSWWAAKKHENCGGFLWRSKSDARHYYHQEHKI